PRPAGPASAGPAGPKAGARKIPQAWGLNICLPLDELLLQVGCDLRALAHQVCRLAWIVGQIVKLILPRVPDVFPVAGADRLSPRLEPLVSPEDRPREGLFLLLEDRHQVHSIHLLARRS